MAAIAGYEKVSVQADRPWLGRSTRRTRACSARTLATVVQLRPWPNRPCRNTTRGPVSPRLVLNRASESGAGHGRRDQQPVCQCRRSSTGEDDSRPGVCGQATMWARPGGIGCEQPGQR